MLASRIMQLSCYNRLWLSKKTRKLDTLHCFGEGKGSCTGVGWSVLLDMHPSDFLPLHQGGCGHKMAVNQQWQPTCTAKLQVHLQPKGILHNSSRWYKTTQLIDPFGVSRYLSEKLETWIHSSSNDKISQIVMGRVTRETRYRAYFRHRSVDIINQQECSGEGRLTAIIPEGRGAA